MTNVLNLDMREGRLRAIAINAVKEARLAYGRDHLPWTDNDAQRTEMFFKLLHLVPMEDIESRAEHQPVVAPQQAPFNPKLVDMDKLLDTINELEDDEKKDDPAIAIKLPKAVQNKS